MSSGNRGGARRAGRGGRWARPVAEVLEGRQLLATITVNSTSDADGVNGADTLSLRQAIEIADGNLRVSSLTPAQQALVVGDTQVQRNTIDFAIPGTGPFTIAPATTLPTVIDTTIDGYSQPGAMANTNGPGLPDNAVIEIELSGARLQIGSPAAPAYSGSGLIAADATIQGLAIDGFGGVVPATDTTPAQIAGGGVVFTDRVFGGVVNQIQGDFIGVGLNGETPSGNAGAGVIIYRVQGTIGGTAPADRNVIAGNGVNIDVMPSTSVAIQGNFVGTDATGTRALGGPAAPFGQGIIANNLDTIGGTTAGTGNVISGNRVGIQGSGLVEGNLIGTDLTGTKTLGNTEYGIYIGTPPPPIVNEVTPSYFSSMTVGGTTASARNIISGNKIGISAQNYQVSNVLPLAHPGEGIYINLPSGAGQVALIQGNFIGTDPTGTVALGNVVGIQLANFGKATVGGTAAGAGNVISGNTQNGLEADWSASGNLIQGNLIGTDLTGTKPLGNGGLGVFLAGHSNTVGGIGAGAGNVIAGNKLDGLVISPQPLSFEENFYNPEFYPNPLPPTGLDLVQGNFIGTDLTQALPLGNGGAGVVIAASANTIGGVTAGTGNAIAFNKGAGVGVINYFDSSANPPAVTPGTGFNNFISGNAIFANVGLGIDLGLDGVTPNNPGGSAAGPNHLQPYPVLTSSAGVSTGSLVSGTLDALPSTPYTVEFFSNPAGSGQGQTYLGLVNATTDAAGHASITFGVPPTPAGQFITATATDPQGDTSEFARSILVTTAPTATTMTASLLGPNRVATLGQPITFTAKVAATAANGVATGQVAFAQDGVVLGLATLDASGTATFTTASLLPGPHLITADYLGDATHAASLSGAVAVSVLPGNAFAGPGVTSVVFAGPNSVTISFNRGLLLGPAQDMANYAIVGPGHHKVTVESAVYNPQGATVTLTTLQALDPRQSYSLTINGSKGDRVVDVFGIPLNGQRQGKPGHDYSDKIAVKKAPVVVKVVHPSGPKKAATHPARKAH